MTEELKVTYYITDDGWVYTDSFGLAELTGRTDERVGVEEIDGVKTLVIPKCVDGKEVYLVSFHGFESGFEALYVPDGVGIIGPHAFAGCRALKTVRVPEDIYEIADTAFLLTAVPKRRQKRLYAMGRMQDEVKADQERARKREEEKAELTAEPGNDIPF